MKQVFNRHNKTAPSLRFGEFQQPWNESSLGSIFVRQNNKNTENNTNVLTISAQQGLVIQEDYFTKSVSSLNLTNYYLLHKDDFAYNKSYSQGYPMGAIKRLKHYEKGVVSPLYICFKLNKPNYSLEYFEEYFEAGFINREINKIAQEGARNHGLLNMGVTDFFNDITLHFPELKEQIKIGDFLTLLNEWIDILSTRQVYLNEYYRGLTQKIFTHKFIVKNINGQPFPEWKTKKLRDVFSKKTERNFDNSVRNVLTNSAVSGIVNQKDYFDKDIANQNNLLNYFIVDIDDFVYNPRISKSSPVGPLNRNKIIRGIMSPLYTVLKINSGVPEFYDEYFSTSFWHHYMYKIANYGARHDRMSILQDDFMSMPIPFPSIEEQKLIANYLSIFREYVATNNKLLIQIKNWKKGLVNKLFI